MPLIYWFTQPGSSVPLAENRFSSYYLYDTGTKKFCRIRLGLGRSTATASKGETNVSYHPDRAVGFGSNLPSGGTWSVNEKFELCYNGNPLKSAPPPNGFRDYDGTVVTSHNARTLSDFHPGSVVTVEPKLLPGIEPKYLALLANDAIVNKSVYTLTAANATGVEVAQAIQGHVVRILKVQNFGEVTNELILNKLKEQVKAISGDAVIPAQENLNKALDAVKSTNALISKQLETGSVPNKDLESAFNELQSALNNADTASRKGSVQEVLAQINKAQEAVRTALNTISDGQQDTATLLKNATQSLSEAEQGARDWATVETDYRPLTDAGNVDDYMKILSGGDV